MLNFFIKILENELVKQTDNNFKTIPGGLLIAFEGIDGSGKTTLAKQIATELAARGYNAVYLREPTDGPYGQRLREIMVSPEKRDPQQEFKLFLMDRREDVQLNILPVLNDGGIVCIDRYYISSMAYQGALGLDADMIRRENEQFAPIPHLILRFVVPVAKALERIHTTRADGANSFEKKEYLEKVHATFETMKFPQMVDIPADRPLTDVFEETWTVVAQKLS